MYKCTPPIYVYSNRMKLIIQQNIKKIRGYNLCPRRYKVVSFCDNKNDVLFHPVAHTVNLFRCVY